MGSKIYGVDNCRGRRASKELHLPVLTGAWALGDGVDVQLLEEFRSRGRAQSPAPPRQSGSGSPSVWSSLLESLTGALDLSGGWEYSRSDGNRQTASRSGSGGSAGGGGPASSSSGTGGGADGVVLLSSGSRSTGGGGLMQRSCSSSVVPSVASVVTPALEAPAPLGRTNSGGGTAAAAGASRRFDGLLLRSGRTGSGGSSAAASARTSACGLPSTAASSGMGSAATTCSGMSAATNIAGLSLSAGGGYMNTSASTPTAGRSTRSSSGSGCTSCGSGSGSGATAAVTFGHLALLPASGCADRDLIDSVLASPRGGLLAGVPAQVSVCKQD